MTGSLASRPLLLGLARCPRWRAACPRRDPMRGNVPILDEAAPPRMQAQENKDVRRVRSHSDAAADDPAQDRRLPARQDVNRCMFCHSRTRIEETRAIPVSVTHYMDRDGNVRGDVSPRRYFCTQCHVPQDEVKPLVENRFQDFETRVAPSRGAKAAPKSK